MVIKRALQKKEKLNTAKLQNHPDVVRKHQKALEGTGFEGCAVCPGCSGKAKSFPLPDNGQGEELRMRCSRSGPSGEFITADQAARCDGGKPFVASPVRHAHHHDEKGHRLPHRRPVPFMALVA